MYALTDVQSMLDRMKNALRIVHGRGLDPDAGKARYEPMFFCANLAWLISAGQTNLSSRTIQASFLKSAFRDHTSIWFRRMPASRLTYIHQVFSRLILVLLVILIRV